MPNGGWEGVRGHGRRCESARETVWRGCEGVRGCIDRLCSWCTDPYRVHCHIEAWPRSCEASRGGGGSWKLW